MNLFKSGLLLATALLTLICGPLAPNPAHANPGVSFEFFYDNLHPYGEWVDLPEYGLCWRPSRVEEDWAPYTDGYWANTDAGWTWVSYEDWGGITYHYGRWARVSEEGWFWVPDYQWAPAWVSWRYSDDYVGWAPLPPSARWEPRIGFSFWVDSHCHIGPTYYNFCHVRHFGNPALRPVIIDRRRNVTIINQTTNITNITVINNNQTVYNGGPNFATVSRRSERPIQVLKLRQETQVTTSPGHPAPLRARQQGHELLVVAPKVDAPTTKFTPPQPARTLAPKAIDTGWAGINDPKVRTQIQSKFKQESRNVIPSSAPAHAPSQREMVAFEKRLQNQPRPQVQPIPQTNPQLSNGISAKPVQPMPQGPQGPQGRKDLQPESSHGVIPGPQAPSQIISKQQTLPTPKPQAPEIPSPRTRELKPLTPDTPDSGPSISTADQHQKQAAPEQLQNAQAAQEQRRQEALDQQSRLQEQNRRRDEAAQQQRRQQQAAQEQLQASQAAQAAQAAQQQRKQEALDQQSRLQEQNRRRDEAAQQQRRQQQAAQEQLQASQAAQAAQAAQEQRKQEALDQQSRLQEQNRRRDEAAQQQRRQQQAAQEQLQASQAAQAAQAAQQQRRQEALDQQSRLQEQNRRRDEAAQQQRRQQQAAQEQLQRSQEAQQRRAEQSAQRLQQEQARQPRGESQRHQSDRPTFQQRAPQQAPAPSSNDHGKKDRGDRDDKDGRR